MSRKTKTTATKDEARPALVPKLRFPEFREAEGWNVDLLGNVAEFVNEKIPLERVEVENYISTENILPDYGGITRASKLPATGSVTRFRANDTLVSNIRPYLKKVWVADKEGGASNDVIVIRAKQRLLKQYLSCLLKNDAFIDYVMTGAKGVKMPRGDIASMKAYPALYPTKPEQQKIAECLSSVDELMAVQARKVDALKTHKKGLMQHLFPREGETVPRLRFPEFQNAGEWEEKKLGTVCDIQRGKFSHRPRNDPRFFGGPYPFIQTGDVVKSEGGAVIASQSLNVEGLAVSKLFRPTIVLITIAANIGDTGLLKTEGCFTDSVVGLIPSKGVIPVFLELIMRGQKENLNKVATTGAQKNINNEILREVSILLPSVPEQHRIASCLTTLDALITAETQKLEALKAHKKGLMQQLFPSPEEVET